LTLEQDDARRPGLNSQRGFSLVEVIAAMAAGLIVLLAALQSVLYFQREFVRQHEQIVQQQDVRLGLELFEQELRLAGWGALSVIRPDAVEFTANVSGLMTNVIALAAAGQTTLTVEDGRGWPENKLARVCWNDHCDNFTLARAGQRNLLTLVEPASRPIPSGASVMVMNRVRYYSRPDEHGILRWLRQIDGGASVITSNIARLTLSYWDAQGRPTMHPHSVRRILVKIALPGRVVSEVREIGLRM
jgi:prepilin-type N-terminal cleavage/methylation domain-containing protein